MACTDIDIYEDIKHCAGTVNSPGLTRKLFAIKKSNITSWPTRPKASAEGATLESIVTITGNFALAADAKWMEVGLVPDQNKIAFNNQGNWGSKTVASVLTAVIPGTGKNVSGFCAMANNDELVYLAQERTGAFRLLGDENYDVTTEFAGDTGAAVSSDSNQTTLTITSTNDVPAPYYEGNIVTSDGTISGKDGKPVTTEYVTKPATTE